MDGAFKYIAPMQTSPKEVSASGSAAIRRTEAGDVRGVVGNGVCRFLAVPYAAPPVGANRFREPQPVEAWPGVLDALEPGASAPYKTPDFPKLDIVPLVGRGRGDGEDYLTVHIWAPEHASKRPVMVWIHGGAFVIGSKDASIHDAAEFAKSGVISVAVNYRLGIDGFLPIPGVPTNLGLRDMLAALKWVQRNIEVGDLSRQLAKDYDDLVNGRIPNR